ncbi:hypothetical protein KIMH_10320 [Bombiscardovia apis]|uniref:TPM domain-containing protein n=1 Tax=Bombiscardovia apis TaxID=2932182 RepID=A0ABM8BDF0_9BIFI|nr:TPM domain-containing protein [Bombiscardovia apis]BDR54921.1 hypothetical protein KIMH_10320 [Bombiscardovia apis]
MDNGDCLTIKSGTGRVASVLALVSALCLLLLLLVPADSARADAASPSSDLTSSQGSVGMLSDQITDTQNLLGSNVGAVSDAIAQTEQTTGVHVRLLYLPTFYQGTNPDTWASQVLESSKPKENTLLLAVASKDGNLVVAVSANSDSWLKQQSTVDDLSNAALDPISGKDNPDWVGSAQALMEQVSKSKEQADRRTYISYGIVAIFAILLVVLGALTYWLRQRKRGAHQRHSKHSGNIQTEAAS